MPHAGDVSLHASPHDLIPYARLKMRQSHTIHSLIDRCSRCVTNLTSCDETTISFHTPLSSMDKNTRVCSLTKAISRLMSKSGIIHAESLTVSRHSSYYRHG